MTLRHDFIDFLLTEHPLVAGKIIDPKVHTKNG
jgi:hypothetical protein